MEVALQKCSPAQFTTAGGNEHQNDFYTAYLVDNDGIPRFLTRELKKEGVTGLWSQDGKNFTDPCSIPNSAFSGYRIDVQQYYRGWQFSTEGYWPLIWHYLLGYAFIAVKLDRAIQFFFNRRRLVRRDRMLLLKHVLANTIVNRSYHAYAAGILTDLYSARWIKRPDRLDLLAYYELLLESLKVSEDLKLMEHGYAISPKALNTISDYDQEERRHRDNGNVQKWLVALTVVLSAAAIVQAVSAYHEAWK